MESVQLIRQEYAKAKPYNDEYSDLSWFPWLCRQSKRDVKKVAKYAKQNKVYIELGLGNADFLEECVLLAEEHPEELLVAILFILEYSKKFNISIDSILDRFQAQIEKYPHEQTEYSKNITVSLNRYFNVCIDCALYYFNQGNYEKARDYAVKGLNSPVGINNGKEVFKRLAPLYEHFPDLFIQDRKE
uniref:hypothetical protein n=1 Tax=Saccharibacillus sp. CPCC 101409 TaxID=3058041 RepID=UPI002672EC4C|nr:hypothetical protein [Saccharibacillus sp. CPCC 101409]